MARAVGSPWVVVLTLGLAAVVLAVVVAGLWLGRGQTDEPAVVDIPARRDTAAQRTVPPTSTPATSAPPATRGTATTVPTTAPGGLSLLPRVDTITPRVKVNDADGRFQITVPRTWGNLPTPVPDQNVWVPSIQTGTGELTDSDFLFVVRWAPALGCTLERCAEAVLERLKTVYPTIKATTSPDLIGGELAVRIDATAEDQRVVAWVVVKGDRYWVPQLRGPIDTFDPTLAVVQPIVGAMSFG